MPNAFMDPELPLGAVEQLQDIAAPLRCCGCVSPDVGWGTGHFLHYLLLLLRLLLLLLLLLHYFHY
jgi:hypothetical protein